MLKVSDHTDLSGDTIALRFVPTPEPRDDEHLEAEALARAEADAVVFTLRTRVLPGALWEKLVREHPPQPGSGDDYDVDTMPPVLIAESVTGWHVDKAGETLEAEDRPPTVDEAAELWNEWPEWARRRLLRPLISQNVTGPALGKVR